MQAYKDIDAFNEASRSNLLLWLANHGGIVGKLAESYYNLIYGVGVGTVDLLESELKLDKSFLSTIGFRQHHVDLIMLAYSAKSSAVVKH